MIVFLNGKCVPEEQARLSIFDRGFLYGDGVFETLRIAQGKPFRWRQHFERLQRGADFLGVGLPFNFEQLSKAAADLVRENQMSEAALRLVVSRGVGPRGYSTQGAENPTVVMSLHCLPTPGDAGAKSWRVTTSSVRLRADDPCSQFKTCNKLPQILARREAETAGADEALLLNQEGWVVEGSSSNLFWIQNGAVNTPPLSSGALSGVTRALVLERCSNLGIACHEVNAKPSQLLDAEGLFFTLSTLGVVPASHLDNRALNQSRLMSMIGTAYSQLQELETRS